MGRVGKLRKKKRGKRVAAEKSMYLMALGHSLTVLEPCFQGNNNMSFPQLKGHANLSIFYPDIYLYVNLCQMNNTREVARLLAVCFAIGLSRGYLIIPSEYGKAFISKDSI